MPVITNVKPLIVDAVTRHMSFYSDQYKSDVPGPTGASGLTGPQGLSVHHLKPTSTTQLNNDFHKPGETDTYTLYGDLHERVNLGNFSVHNGVDPYDYALLGGFTGTRVDFNALLGTMATVGADTQEALEATLAAANTALAAQVAVEQVFDNFDDRYLGSKDTDPTLDNDGDLLVVGQVYWNNISTALRFFNGSAWEAPSVQAATSARNALASEVAAKESEEAVARDLLLTNADVVTTHQDAVATNADVVKTHADLLSTNANVLTTVGNVALTNADVTAIQGTVAATHADAVSTAADRTAVHTDASNAAVQASEASASAAAAATASQDAHRDLLLTNADATTTSADVVSTHADLVLTRADVALSGSNVALTNADVVLTHADAASTSADRASVEDAATGAAATVATLAARLDSDFTTKLEFNAQYTAQEW